MLKTTIIAIPTKLWVKSCVTVTSSKSQHNKFQYVFLHEIFLKRIISRLY